MALVNTGEKQYNFLVQVKRYADQTEVLTGLRKPNTSGDPDYIPNTIDYVSCPLRAKAWKGDESNATCQKDGLNQNTGIKIYQTLVEYYVDNGQETGVVKPNSVGDPNYIAPVTDTTYCPIIRATGWRVLNSSVYCIQDGNGNNGYKAWNTLEQYYLDNSQSTGEIKPNISGDPNYVSPVYDEVACPVNIPLEQNNIFVYGSFNNPTTGWSLNCDAQYLVSSEVTIFVTVYGDISGHEQQISVTIPNGSSNGHNNGNWSGFHPMDILQVVGVWWVPTSDTNYEYVINMN